MENDRLKSEIGRLQRQLARSQQKAGFLLASLDRVKVLATDLEGRLSDVYSPLVSEILAQVGLVPQVSRQETTHRRDRKP